MALWDQRHPKAQASARTAYAGQLEGWISIIINLLMFALKIVFGLKIRSYALVADAIHSLSDSISSIAIIIGLKASNKPPDKEHPFGHGRLEFVTSLILAGFLFLAGYELCKASFTHISSPSMQNPSFTAILIVCGTIIANEVLARIAFVLGDYCGSATLKIDGQHHRADSWSSSLVLVAFLGSYFNLFALDGIVGLIISAWILFSALSAAKQAISPLIGEAPTTDELKAVELIAKQHSDIHNVHDIVFHKYGHNRLLSLHIEISDTLSLIEAHKIAESIEDEIKHKLSAAVVVHTDPINLKHPLYETIDKAILSVITPIRDIEASYALRMIEHENKTTEAAFCISLAEGCTLSHEQVKQTLLQALNPLFPDMTFTIHISPQWAYTPPHS